MDELLSVAKNGSIFRRWRKPLTLGKERNKRPLFLAEVSALLFLSLRSLNRDFHLGTYSSGIENRRPKGKAIAEAFLWDII